MQSAFAPTHNSQRHHTCAATQPPHWLTHQSCLEAHASPHSPKTHLSTPWELTERHARLDFRRAHDGLFVRQCVHDRRATTTALALSSPRRLDESATGSTRPTVGHVYSTGRCLWCAAHVIYAQTATRYVRCRFDWQVMDWRVATRWHESQDHIIVVVRWHDLV